MRRVSGQEDIRDGYLILWDVKGAMLLVANGAWAEYAMPARPLKRKNHASMAVLMQLVL
ncbi:hypothetical protein [Gluconacetobacter entanii]|uniref:hypothetical protein n=1 Tax=Gluconacetobacter entanii TaxID=108528 RepID=UPI00142E36FD|nr:hypothetical protein [Gluconacetobacter entanii]